MIRAFLYDGKGHDHEIALARSLPKLSKEKLLWVDVVAPTAGEIEKLRKLFKLANPSIISWRQNKDRPRLSTFGSYMQFQLIALALDGEAPTSDEVAETSKVTFLFSELWLITIQTRKLPYLEKFRAQDRGETRIGELTGAGLLSALLDWHLETYLSAAANVEAQSDGIDMAILSGPDSPDRVLNQIVSARRLVSQLLRLLELQRPVFYGLSRTDIELAVDGEANAHFEILTHRFERVFDIIQNGRNLIRGSFDLLAAQMAQNTNVLLRRLTFLSIILGIVGAVAGIFGMNFATRFTQAGEFGFWLVMGFLSLTLIILTVVFRWLKLI
jgi:magnesium transporter